MKIMKIMDLRGLLFLCSFVSAVICNGCFAKPPDDSSEDYTIPSYNEFRTISSNNDAKLYQILVKTAVIVFNYLSKFIQEVKQHYKENGIQSCNGEEMRPDMLDETKYEICSDRTWIRKTCPVGQKFDISMAASSVETPCSPICRNGELQSVDAESFKRYEVCIDGVWEERICPDGKIFNAALGLSDAEMSREVNRIMDDFDISAINDSPHCVDICEDGKIVQGNTDNEYYICVEYKWELRECNNGEVYDAGLTVSPTIIEDNFSGDFSANTKAPYRNPCRKTCSNGTFMASTNGNDKYLKCNSNEWFEETCPDGKVYDATFETKAQIRRKTRKVMPCSNACEEGSIQANNMADNTVYEICVNGLWVYKSCPPYHKVNSLDTQNICVETCVDGHIRASEKGINKYYLCEDNVWVEETCKFGDVFVGDGYHEIRFGDNSDDETNFSYPCQSIIAFRLTNTTCEPNSMKPFPSDPTKYYKCVDSKLVVQQCSKGKKFNERKLKCSKKHHRTTDY